MAQQLQKWPLVDFPLKMWVIHTSHKRRRWIISSHTCHIHESMTLMTQLNGSSINRILTISIFWSMQNVRAFLNEAENGSTIVSHVLTPIWNYLIQRKGTTKEESTKAKILDKLVPTGYLVSGEWWWSYLLQMFFTYRPDNEYGLCRYSQITLVTNWWGK